MKVYYFNDELRAVSVQTRKKGGEAWEWDYTVVAPASGHLFMFDAPTNTLAYVKKWGSKVLIDYVDESALLPEGVLS